MTTEGTEIETLKQPEDVIKRFCLDALKKSSFVRGYRLPEKISPGNLSNRDPDQPQSGETASFPIEQQHKIFQIIGDVEGYIGVRLSENCALIPTKSHSGIYFSTAVEFVSCRLCTNPRCQGRRAPYEPELALRSKNRTIGYPHPKRDRLTCPSFYGFLF